MRQLALQRMLAAALASYLGRLPDLSDEALATYVRVAYPLVRGGQQVAANYGAGYVLALARLAGPVEPVALDVTGALERSGKLVALDSRSLPAPVLRARALVDEGEAMRQAIAAAQSYAHGLSSTDLRVAEQVGVREGARAARKRVVGYRKELDPGCCDWCRLVSDRVYKSVPFHQRDRCSVAPVFEGER